MPNPPNIHEIETSYGFLSNLNVYLLIFAGLIAIAIAVVALLSNREGNKLKEAQKAEILRKDNELTIALKNKDIQIEAAKAVAATANERAATANQKVAEANEKAEAERLDRIRLEAELAPRTLEQRQSANELLRFRGIKVVIESLAESEPWRTAGQIAWTLNNAKWNILPGMKRFLDATNFFDGVAIETNVGPRPQEDHSGEAAEALVMVLTKNNIKAHTRPAIGLPLNTIKIRVGLKPATYFQRNRKDMEYGNMLYK